MKSRSFIATNRNQRPDKQSEAVRERLISERNDWMRRAEVAEVQLASMTKRAEEVTADDLRRLRTAPRLDPDRHLGGRAEEESGLAWLAKQREMETRQLERLIFLLNAAEAKLATAVEGLREIAGRALSYAGWAAECARSTLRAVGIDPSKERGK